jgi:aspartyl-tRNA(Asn)/glutamyl-tRNA(Gln) amidotransferase subunit B
LNESLPELPEPAVHRLVKEYGITEEMALVIVADRPAIALYELAVATVRQERNTGDAKQTNVDMERMVANWLCNDLFGLVKAAAAASATTQDGEEDSSVQQSKVDGRQLGLLVALILEGTVSTTMAKKILHELYHASSEYTTVNDEDDNDSTTTTITPRDIAMAKGWQLMTDPGELHDLCHGVVHDPKHAKQLSQYQQGGKKVWKLSKFFVGKAMAMSKGNAHPERLQEALEQVLSQATSSSQTNE